MLHNSYTLNYTKFKNSMQLDNFPKYIPISPGLWVHFTTNSDCNKFVQKTYLVACSELFRATCQKSPAQNVPGRKFNRLAFAAVAQVHTVHTLQAEFIAFGGGLFGFLGFGGGNELAHIDILR